MLRVPSIDNQKFSSRSIFNLVKVTIKELRKLIRETLSEPYTKSLLDDDSFNEESVVVNNTAKEKIKKFFKDLRLAK